MEKPFQLEQGIFFEDSKKMLLWGESFEDLKNIDDPEISEDGKTLNWYGKSCFGGQKLNVKIFKDQYTNKNNTLESIFFEEENETQSSIYKTAEKYSAFFTEYFGEPSQSMTMYGRTTELWNIDALQIILGIGERFTDFLIFAMHYGERTYKLNDN